MVVWIDKLINLVFRKGHQCLSSAFTSFFILSCGPKFLDCLELDLGLTVFCECVVKANVCRYVHTKIDKSSDIMRVQEEVWYGLEELSYCVPATEEASKHRVNIWTVHHLLVSEVEHGFRDLTFLGDDEYVLQVL